MSEEQQMPEYKQGDNVRLTVELRDQNGVGQVDALVVLQGSSSDDPHRELHHPQREEEDAVGEAESIGREREVTRDLGGDGGQRGAIALADRGERGEERDDA